MITARNSSEQPDTRQYLRAVSITPSVAFRSAEACARSGPQRDGAAVEFSAGGRFDDSVANGSAALRRGPVLLRPDPWARLEG